MNSVSFDLDERGVAVIYLDSPVTYNSLDGVVLRKMLEYFDRCESAGVRVLCVRGNGKHFCAGADIKGLARQSSESTPTLIRALQRLNQLPFPTIAMVHGGASRIPMINATTASVAEFDAFVFSMILAPPMALTKS